MRVWSARIPQYAFKSAYQGKKRSHGAQLRLNPGLATSHPVDPGPLEMTTIVQLDVRDDSYTPSRGAKNASMERTHPPVSFQFGFSR